jgi:carbonic anhydrase/acetyltransferase-like protein (isoleucine patch superfamily)
VQDQLAFADLKEKSLNVPAKVLKADPSAITRTDLTDTRVYICSQTVLIHFSDNIDYMDLRRHYIHNEVLNVDMGFRFNAHILTDAYVGTVSDVRSLHACTQDLMRGLAHPVRPTELWACSAASLAKPDEKKTAFEKVTTMPWSAAKHGTFIQKSASVDGSSRVYKSLVAAGARIGAGAVIEGSVIGPNAIIEAGARVVDCILFTGVKVGAGAEIVESILGDEVAVGAESIVSFGSVIGSSCSIAAKHTVPPFTHITGVPNTTTFASSKVSYNDDFAVGPGGSGRSWPNSEEFEDIFAAQNDSDDDDDEDGDAEPQLSFASAQAVVDAQKRAYDGFRMAMRDVKERRGQESDLPPHILSNLLTATRTLTESVR